MLAVCELHSLPDAMRGEFKGAHTCLTGVHGCLLVRPDPAAPARRQALPTSLSQTGKAGSDAKEEVCW
jgi:hypothetical protein